ncbi:unnamed protein product, partial [Closterium sp. NIES-54]
LLSRLLSLVTAPHPLRRVVRRAAATLLCLAREPRTHAAFQPLLPALTRAAFASAPPAPHATSSAAAPADAAGAGGAAAGDAAAGGGGGKEKGCGDAEVSAALAEVVWRVSCEPGADDWRLPEGENVGISAIVIRFDGLGVVAVMLRACNGGGGADSGAGSGAGNCG